VRAWYALRLLLEFAWSLVDRFHVLLAGPEGLDIDRSAVPGLQEKLYGEHAGQGVMMISGHLGNPDMGGSLLRGERRVHLLLYRAPNDPYFALLQEMMGDRAPGIIAINDGSQLASLEAIRALEAGDVVAAKGDRVVDGRTARCEFLGAPIDVPTGPFLLAALSGAPVVFIGCFRTGHGRYRFEAVGPKVLKFRSRKTRNEDLAQWAQEWASVMEAWTEAHPLQWFNFFDPWEQAANRLADASTGARPRGRAASKAAEEHGA
jgi:predicted LPLAT superfamily acyltransferase